MAIDPIQEFASRSEPYKKVLAELQAGLCVVRVASVVLVKDGKAVSIRLQVGPHRKSRMIDPQLAREIALSGDGRPGWPILLKMLDLPWRARQVVDRSRRTLTPPPVRYIEAKLIEDIVATSGPALETVGRALAAAALAACSGRGGTADAELRRRQALGAARKHLERAFNTGISRDEVVELWAQIATERALQGS